MKWISVKDRLPEKHEEGICPTVIVRHKTGEVAENLIQETLVNSEWLRLHPERYTYWMPLPEPPEDKA